MEIDSLESIEKEIVLKLENFWDTVKGQDDDTSWTKGINQILYEIGKTPLDGKEYINRSII